MIMSNSSSGRETTPPGNIATTSMLMTTNDRIDSGSCKSVVTNKIDSTASSAQDTKRTRSFDAVWAGTLSDFYTTQQQQQPTTSFDLYGNDPTVKVHTLVVGTHPSIQSLSKRQYYGHPLNAFWWIAGDCLGFRRDTGLSAATDEPYKLSAHLRHPPADIVPYAAQMTRFCRSGFALWDLIESCEREGSLDQDIEHEQVNDLQAFCERHPDVRRIVLSNGQTQCKLFLKHFRDWWDDDVDTVLVPGDNELSRKVFGKRYARRSADDYGTERRIISCVCMLGVSPANARVTYPEKRDYWEKYCYEPGLLDRERLNGKTKSVGSSSSKEDVLEI